MLLNKQLVDQFIKYTVDMGEFDELDAVYVQNKLIAILNAQGIEDELTIDSVSSMTPNDIAQLWIDQAVKANAIEDERYIREIVEAQILDLITPKPSAVNNYFWQQHKENPKLATDYFYELSKRNHYVKEDAIAKNISYNVATDYGDIEITINLSKPEKDGKQIAKEKNATASAYPQCALCFENEGYIGSVLQAARTNHRIIRMNLAGNEWGFQYSPYAYFNEHSIVLSRTHEPMAINQQTFENLVEFVQQFPHYFIGSNADIPIVGGSILSHNHYQAGRHEFPMDRATTKETFKLTSFPDIDATTLKWPMSVIRLKSNNSARLIKAATYVMEQWNNYSDSSVDIKAYSDDGTRHHTITPIVRYKNEHYEIDIVLRDNQTSNEYPEGIFHPHQDVQHIKKENIGLIEVMGTAILPGRLKSELVDVKNYLLGKSYNELGPHKQWAETMAQNYQINNDNVDEIIYKEVGLKFKSVLADAGVFKDNEQGNNAFKQFLNVL